MNNTHRTQPHTCPTCGYAMDAHTGLGTKRSPNKGDFGVCLKCGEIMVFNEDQSLRQAELKDLVQLDHGTQFLLEQTQNRIRQARLIK